MAGILPAMSELIHLASTPRTRDGSVRLVGVAERQWGVVRRAQLVDIGLSPAAISRWIEEKRLHRVYPGVYAVGHLALGIQGKLAAALFYAGPGAMLSHGTGAWWWQLMPHLSVRVHVTAPGRRRSLNDVCVHRPRREVERVWHKRLPVTPPSQTLLDIAAALPFQRLRRALAEAEYLRLVTLDEVEGALGRGRPGSGALRVALECHRPELARTRSLLEEKFLLLCERYGLTLPEVNVRVAGWLVDAVWFDARVVVEFDGHAAHGMPAAMEQDRRRELELRAAGYTVLRYTWKQITEQPELVVSDLLAHL